MNRRLLAGSALATLLVVPVAGLVTYELVRNGTVPLTSETQIAAKPVEAGERARIALALYVRRIVREIGALVAVLGGLDLLVFTAGVGEHSAPIRARICADLAYLGLRLDTNANAADAAVISGEDSDVMVGVEPTNEEWVAAVEARAAISHRASP